MKRYCKSCNRLLEFKEHRVRCSHCNNLICHKCRGDLSLCCTCENKLISSGWFKRYSDQWGHVDIKNYSSKEITVDTIIAFYIEDLWQTIRELMKKNNQLKLSQSISKKDKDL